MIINVLFYILTKQAILLLFFDFKSSPNDYKSFSKIKI